MILVLDVGNSQIFGGVFQEDKIIFQFRKNSRQSTASDEIGVFLRSVLRENEIDPNKIEKIAFCSVVPEIVHSLTGACLKYFNRSPFILQAGAKTGLKIKYRNPLEVGADRIANAIAAVHLYPDQDVIVIDMGTATTFCLITASRDFMGGVILPGLRLSMEALESHTAKLPPVEIIAPVEIIGRSTIECIQSGLYFGNLCVLRELTRMIRENYLQHGKGQAKIIGTGGFSRLYRDENVFDVLVPELILIGLHRALQMNV